MISICQPVTTQYLFLIVFAECVFIFAQTSPPPLNSLFAKQPVFSAFEIIAFINRKRTNFITMSYIKLYGICNLNKANYIYIYLHSQTELEKKI